MHGVKPFTMAGIGQVRPRNSSPTLRPIQAKSAAHMAGELFNIMAEINMVHVPYRGLAPALNDLLGGHIVNASSH